MIIERDELVVKMIDDIMEREGWPLYTNRAADRGGPTKGGITLKTLAEWRGHKVTPAELMQLSEAEAKTIYHQRYLRPWEFIPHDGLFQACVDYAVTSWHDDPTYALQGIVGVEQDGRLGPLTRRAVLLYPDPEFLRRRVLAHRIKKMVDLALNDSKLQALIRWHDDLQIRNLRGWINRVTDQF